MSDTKNYINILEEPTPLNKKYFYIESQGLWFIITLIKRDNQEDRIMFEARIENILWRQGRHDIGDTFSFGRSKSAQYSSWNLSLLTNGLENFLKDYYGKSELQLKHLELNLNTIDGIISLIKKLKRDKWNAKMGRRRARIYSNQNSQ